MLYSPPFITMAFANLFTVSSFGTFFLFPLFITGHGGSKSDIGVIMGVFALSSVLCRPWISDMIDRIGRKRSYTSGCMIMSILPLTYLLFRGELSHFYLPLILVRAFHGVGLAICFTAVYTYIADIVPEGRLNEGIGMFGITGITGLAIGPIIGETIIRTFGFPIFFLAATGMATLGLLLALHLPESFKSVSHESTQSFFSVLIERSPLTVAVLALLFGVSSSASGSFVSPFAKEQDLAFISLYYISYSSAAILTRLFAGRVADRVGEERIMPHAQILTGGGLLILILLGGNTILALSGFLLGCGHGLLFPCLNALAIRDQPIDIRGKITGVLSLRAGSIPGLLQGLLCWAISGSGSAFGHCSSQQALPS
jgi:MFS family permease